MLKSQDPDEYGEPDMPAKEIRMSSMLDIARGVQIPAETDVYVMAFTPEQEEKNGKCLKPGFANLDLARCLSEILQYSKDKSNIRYILVQEAIIRALREVVPSGITSDESPLKTRVGQPRLRLWDRDIYDMHHHPTQKPVTTSPAIQIGLSRRDPPNAILIIAHHKHYKRVRFDFSRNYSGHILCLGTDNPLYRIRYQDLKPYRAVQWWCWNILGWGGDISRWLLNFKAAEDDYPIDRFS